MLRRIAHKLKFWATRPRRIAIDHDDYHAKGVGRTRDGSQFFLTTPFDPFDDKEQGREFLALYLFDRNGRLLDAKIDDLGPRDSLDEERRQSLWDLRLRELGDVSFGRINIRPFAVQRFGMTFGLIAREPEDEDDEWTVELEPGNFMAFCHPWNSGIYDT